MRWYLIIIVTCYKNNGGVVAQNDQNRTLNEGAGLSVGRVGFWVSAVRQVWASALPSFLESSPISTTARMKAQKRHPRRFRRDSPVRSRTLLQPRGLDSFEHRF